LVWTIPALVALGAVVCMPVNVMYVKSAYTDPQGEDQIRDYHEAMVAFRHTSGFVAGMTLAAFLGMLLFLKRRRTDSDRTEPAAVASTVAWAALGGVALAAINAAVAWSLGGPKRIVTGWPSDPIVIDVLRDGIWQVIVGWAAMFPLMSVVGVGVGALLRPAGRVP
jgi:hypothetical protein